MALSGRGRAAGQCPLSGLKQTLQFVGVTSAYDPEPTSGGGAGLQRLPESGSTHKRSERLGPSGGDPEDGDSCAHTFSSITAALKARG
jgi:hypothetical protein